MFYMVFFMNVQKFKADFQDKSGKMNKIIDSCLSKAEWFFPNDLNPKPQKMKSIKYFLKIGFLVADPEKGLKVNPDFTPRNQQ